MISILDVESPSIQQPKMVWRSFVSIHIPLIMQRRYNYALLGVGYTYVLASHKIHFVQTVTIHTWHPVRSLQSSPVLLRNSKHYCISNQTHYSPSLPVPGSDADKHTSAG